MAKDKNGRDLYVGNEVAIPGVLNGIDDGAATISVATSDGTMLTVHPSQVVTKPTIVVEAPEEAPGAGGVGVQKPAKK